jgi:hypothetical protein
MSRTEILIHGTRTTSRPDIEAEIQRGPMGGRRTAAVFVQLLSNFATAIGMLANPPALGKCAEHRSAQGSQRTSHLS